MNLFSRFIEPLGWALLHFLWQGAALAIALGVFLRLAQRSSPRVRYAAAGLALILMLCAACATAWWHMGSRNDAAQSRLAGPVSPSVPLAVPAPPPAGVVDTGAAATVPPSAPLEVSPALLAQQQSSSMAESVTLADRLRPFLPWLVTGWAAGVLLFSLRLVNACRTVRHWRASGSRDFAPEWMARFEALSRRLGLTRPVQLLSSATLAVPVVIGWLKPVILVPAGLFSGIPAAQLEAILAHELAHVRRHDYLINLLQTVVETILFYHPAVWWVSAQLRREREHCCDDIAAALDGGAIGYARALAALEELRAIPAAGVSAAGGSLFLRIRRLAGLPEPRQAGLLWPLTLLTLSVLVAALPWSLLQAGEVPPPGSTAEVDKAGRERALAIAAIKAGRRDEAKQHFLEVLKVLPADKDAHRDLAVIFSMQQPPQFEEARKHFEAALAAGYVVDSAQGDHGLEKLLGLAVPGTSPGGTVGLVDGTAGPAAGSPAARVKPEVILNVRADGTIIWNQQALTREELDQKLSELAKANRKQPVIIRGEANTPYEKIVAALNATHKAGLFHVSFATLSAASAPAGDAGARSPGPAADAPDLNNPGTPVDDAKPIAPIQPSPDAVPESGPDGTQIYRHRDGSRTESKRDDAKSQIEETVFSGAGEIVARRVFTFDRKGRVRYGRIFTATGEPAGSLLYGYEQSSGKLLEEQQFNKEGKLIRRLFYPGALKDPKFAGKFVAFSVDPDNRKSTQQFAVPNLAAEEGDSPPESTSPAANYPAVVALAKDGLIYLDGLKVTPEELRSRLQQTPEAQKTKTLRLEADPAVEMDRVTKVVELIRGAGCKETNLSVKSLENPKVSAAEWLLRNARALVLAGDGTQARAILLRVVELFGSRNAADFLPDYCLPVGDALAALAALDAALAEDPKNPPEIRAKHLAAAVSSSTESLNAYLQYDQTNARSVPCRERMALVYTELGRLLTLKGQLADALIACREAMHLYVELKAEVPGNPDYAFKALSVQYQGIRARLDAVRSKDLAGRQKDLKALLSELNGHLAGLRDFVQSQPRSYQARLLLARATLTSAEVQWDRGNVPEAREEHGAAVALVRELQAVPAPSVDWRRELNEFATRLAASSAADPESSQSPGAGDVDPETRVLLHSIAIPEKTDTSSVQQQRALMDDLRQKLVDGADFAALAREHSRDSKQEKGGAWGWVGPNELSKAFAPVVFALQKGLSPVMSLEGYYYLFRIEDIQTRTSLEVKRHHDRSAALFDLGQYARARAEVDEALKLDAANDASIRLRDRIAAAMAPGKPESGAPPAAPPVPADTAAVTLTVTDATGKVPLPEFRVIAGVNPGTSGGKDVINWQPHTLRSGRNGALIWPLENAYDEMALRIEADGYLPQVYAGIEKKKGPQEFFIQMVPSQGLPALVLTPDGKPASGATIALSMIQRDAVLDSGKLRLPAAAAGEKPSDQWRRPRVVTTGADGRAMLPPENDPTAALLVIHETGVREISLSDFLAGKDGAVASGNMAWNVKLQPWARIKGQVLWADKAGAGQNVTLTIFRDTYGYPGIISQYARTVTGPDGSFTFDNVLPGAVQLSCPIQVTGDGGKKPMEISLTGRITQLTLASGENPALIGGHGRTVKGKLTGRTDWTGTTFHFHPTAPHIGMSGDDAIWSAWNSFQKSPEGALYFRNGLKVNPDGTFEVPAVLPGDYQIFFKREGEDKYLASGNFSVPPESAGKAEEGPADAGEFKAVP